MNNADSFLTFPKMSFPETLNVEDFHPISQDIFM